MLLSSRSTNLPSEEYANTKNGEPIQDFFESNQIYVMCSKMTELGKFAMLSQKQVRNAESEIVSLKASKIAEIRAAGAIVSEAKRRAKYSEAEAIYFKSQLDESQKVIEMKNRELNTLMESNKESKATITNIKRRYDHAKEEHESEIRDFHTQLEWDTKF